MQNLDLTNAGQTKYNSQPPARKFIPNPGTANSNSIVITNLSNNRNLALRLDQKGKPLVVRSESHNNSQHNLYDLSENNQRIKTQGGPRKRANYSQENLPSVE